jgi:hypothetical protein
MKSLTQAIRTPDDTDKRQAIRELTELGVDPYSAALGSDHGILNWQAWLRYTPERRARERAIITKYLDLKEEDERIWGVA